MINVIDENQVKKIANLAKLNLSKKQLASFAQKLSQVLVIINEIRQVEADDVTPTAQVTGLYNITREDKPDLSRRLSQKEVLANAPDHYQGFIKVKAIF